MRVFALSDIHIDFTENENWVYSLSQKDFTADILILAGDVTDILPSLQNIFRFLCKCFYKVLYVPGNHDLWTCRNNRESSFEKFNSIKKIAEDCGTVMQPFHYGSLSIIPLFGWYDYSFGDPSDDLLLMWSDYSACSWPENYDEKKITRHFIDLNNEFLSVKNKDIITFSHFMPRIDLMPFYIPPDKKKIYPVLGSLLLEKQIRIVNPRIHVFGHTHLNMNVTKNNIQYINNAFGYPYETRIAAKKLICIHEV